MSSTLKMVGGDLHDAAVERLHAAGKFEYSASEYEAAYAHVVQAGEWARRAERLGVMPGSEIVKLEHLVERAGEILREKGFDGIGPDGRVQFATPEQKDAALLQAESELGKVGEPRKDRERLREAADAELVEAAIVAGHVMAHDRAHWLEQLAGAGREAAREALMAFASAKPARDRLVIHREGGRPVITDEKSSAVAAAADALVALAHPNGATDGDYDAYTAYRDAVELVGKVAGEVPDDQLVAVLGSIAPAVEARLDSEPHAVRSAARTWSAAERVCGRVVSDLKAAGGRS